jgi:dihydrofolate synthase/folylpolyglutamate synthase
MDAPDRRLNADSGLESELEESVRKGPDAAHWRRSADWPHLEKLSNRTHWGIKKGLGNTNAMLDAMGRPDRSYPIVLISGTNGKGSVGALLAHAMKSAGNVVGWYTSPHLVTPLERIWIDGQHIGAGALDLLLNEAFETERDEGLEATYFELMTVAAFSAFRMTGVELAIVEVGLGGRWDATNACEPMISVLTNVGLEHQQYLGDTLEAIAREKLCVARDGHTLVVGQDLKPEWLWPLMECRPSIFPAPFLTPSIIAWEHSLVEGHRLNLAGAHQINNLAIALEVMRHLRCQGFPIPDAALWKGIEETQWPGRLWKVPGLDDVWMDGAHNPDGAKVLADHAIACGVQPALFFGAMKDKDLMAMKAQLMRMAPRSITGIVGEGDRWANAERLRSVFGNDLDVLDIQQVAGRLKETDEGIRLVTGSLYLLGDLLSALNIYPNA